jgi:hypothetical protein
MLRLGALGRFIGLMLGASMVPVWAQSGIYTCTDSRGRKITSDRPIIECIDREQKELNPSGTIRRTVDPSFTAHEQAEREELAKQRAAEEARVREERRRDRALLVRYPTIEVHVKERAEAIAQIDAVIAAAKKRTDELNQQKGQIDAEYEFYKKDPTKAPNSLKRQRDDNDRSRVIQAKFISDQDGEKARVNARFDEELVKLKELWGAQAAARAAAAAPAKK